MSGEPIQVVMVPGHAEAYRQWLASRGLRLRPYPGGDLETFIVDVVDPDAAAGGVLPAGWMCPACRAHGVCTDAVRCQCPCQTDGPRIPMVELCGDLEPQYAVRCTRLPHDDTAPHTAPVLGGGLVAWGPAVARWEARRAELHAHATPADRAPGVAPRLAANPAVRTAAARSGVSDGDGQGGAAEAISGGGTR